MFGDAFYPIFIPAVKVVRGPNANFSHRNQPNQPRKYVSFLFLGSFSLTAGVRFRAFTIFNPPGSIENDPVTGPYAKEH